MWTKTYSKTYPNVTKEQIWQLWANVNNWPTWDKELDFCKMEGAFETGNQFILKPKGGPTVKIMLSEVIPHQKFTDYTKFFGATMYDAHELTETPAGLQITHTSTVAGILSFLWVKLVANNVAASIPNQTDALVALARSL